MRQQSNFRKLCTLLVLSCVLSSSLLYSKISIAQPEIEEIRSIEANIKEVKGYKEIKKAITNGNKMRVIVKLKSDKATKLKKINPAWSRLDSLSRTARARGIKEFSKIPRFALAAYEVDTHELDSLLASGGVEAVYEDILVEPQMQYSLPFIQGNMVHTAHTLGVNQAVAILDSGVDLTHPAFSGRVVAEACFSNADNVNSFSLCPNGQAQQFGYGAGDDCYAVYPHWDCTHGTHVAGISAASDSVNSGVAPAANIVSVQVFHRYEYGSRIYASTSDMILALQWVLDNFETYNIAAVNMSIGGEVFSEHCDIQPIKEVIDALRAAGVATVIASGNNARIGASYPGCVSSAITVGATYRDSDHLAGYSNFSSMVDVLAPGSSIYAPVPGNGYSYKSGTSMAAPHVAGAFALLRSAAPGTSVSLIEQTLKNTGNFIYDFRSGATLPRVNLFAAYQTLGAPMSPHPFDIQFENGTWENASVETTYSGYAGSGYVNTADVAGTWVELNVNAPATGEYSIDMRFANGTVSRLMEISLNGSYVQHLDFAGTGSWNTWWTVSAALYMQQGLNTIRLTAAGPDGAPNLDQLRLNLR